VSGERLREGDVFTYRPDERHCREGMAIVSDRADGSHILRDTFWGSGSDCHILTADEMGTVEPLFNLADFDELDRYARDSKSAWEAYHPDNRRVITSQHGLQRRWFIRKGAEPDLSTQIQNAEGRVEDAEDEFNRAERWLQWRREELATILGDTL